MTISSTITAFSLVCTGMMTVKHQGDVDPAEQTEAIYQIDLDQRRWCVDHCPRTFPIAEIEEQYLVLAKFFGDDSTHFVAINRRDGNWTSDYIDENAVYSTIGSCERGDFRGFPAMQF